MKEIKTVITLYQCELCKRTYDKQREAVYCEEKHFPFSIGDKVDHVWFSQSVDGYPYTMQDKNGIILETIMDSCLVEFPDKSRKWCSNNSLTLKDPKPPTPKGFVNLSGIDLEDENPLDHK